jgi:hypothetical protein
VMPRIIGDKGPPTPRLPSLTAAADADDAVHGCDSSAKLKAGQAWRGRHAWIEREAEIRRKAHELDLRQKFAKAVRYAATSRLTKAGAVLCVEMPGREWPNASMVVADLGLSCATSAIRSSIRHGYAAGGLHFYRAGREPRRAEPRNHPVINTNTGDTYESANHAVRALTNLTDVTSTRFIRMRTRIYRSSMDPAGRAVAFGAVWRKLDNTLAPAARAEAAA